MLKSINKMVLFIMCMIFSICLVACNKEDDLIWTNENAVYVSIEKEYKDEILRNVEQYFKNYEYKKIYISEIEADDYTDLILLFVLNEGQDRLEFKKLIEKDKEIEYVFLGKYIPYEKINTQYVEIEKNVISVGEMVEFAIKGNYDAYSQPFSFNAFYIKPKDTSKEYKIRDFPEIGLVKIEKDKYSEWLRFVIETNDYFSLIKAMDKIARLSKVEKIKYEREAIADIFPTSLIYVDNPKIAELILLNGKKYLKGLEPGKVKIIAPGIQFEITVE